MYLTHERFFFVPFREEITLIASSSVSKTTHAVPGNGSSSNGESEGRSLVELGQIPIHAESDLCVFPGQWRAACMGQLHGIRAQESSTMQIRLSCGVLQRCGFCEPAEVNLCDALMHTTQASEYTCGNSESDG